MTFLRVVAPSVFALWPLDGGLPVWSRRADPQWLADQLEREAVAAGWRRVSLWPLARRDGRPEDEAS